MRSVAILIIIGILMGASARAQNRELAPLAGEKRQAEQFDWQQKPREAETLSAGSNTVTLAPCPRGFLATINRSNSNHWIYIDSAPADAQQPGEPVLITGENCPAGATSGTITFDSAYPHGRGYMLESGTGGIKEASVDANQVRYDGARGNDTWIEVAPRATTRIKAPLFWQTTMGRLVGMSLLECSVNSSCINIGDTNSQGFGNGNVNAYSSNVMDGFWVRPDPAMKFWDVSPENPEEITGAQSATLTIGKCPDGFWPRIPGQILWLNGTTDGLVTTPYEPGAPGPGEFVRVTGGSCTPGAANGTIDIAPATPGAKSLFAHGKGYTLSNGATAYIEDNAQATVIENITTNGYLGDVGYGSVIQNDNDQANEVLNVDITGGLRCDKDFCGATLFGPGPNRINAGITNLMFGSNSACAEWYNGNDFYIGPTVCQGFNNFGLFLSNKRSSWLGRALVHSVHRERGGMINSLGLNLGAADMVVQGYELEVDGNGQATTNFPAFRVAGNPRAPAQYYYLSIVNATDGTKSVPIPIGTAQVNDPAVNPVEVKWVSADALPGKSIQFELYRLDPGPIGLGQVPYSGLCDGVGADGKCLVARIDPAKVCDIHGACTFTDRVSRLSAVTPYTGIDGTGKGGYFPPVGFSPGGIVLSHGATYQGEPACLIMTAAWLNEVASTFNNGSLPANCIPTGGSFNVTLNSFSAGQLSYPQPGILLPDRNRVLDGQTFTGIKGRLNLIGGGTYPRDLFTWVDANPEKTMATKGEFGSGKVGSAYGTANRPQWDVGDVATGAEDYGFGFYNRVPGNGVFDWYIGSLPDNAGHISENWSEELSAKAHEFRVPVKVGSSGSAVSQMKLFTTDNIRPALVAANSCGDQTVVVRGLSASDKVTQVTPPGPLTNLSLNAYPGSRGENIILHFCNPTNSAAKPPAGSYSFFAVR